MSAPPSKSIAHRYLICSGLCSGKSVIHGIYRSLDVLATADCIKAMGADVEFDGDTVSVNGTDVRNSNFEKHLYCRESGSTQRFFVPLCLLSNSPAFIKGEKSLFRRPLNVYEKICREQGIEFKQSEDSLYLNGTLSAGEYRVKGNISSQFISGLLFALPMLKEGSTIFIIPPVESRPYIDLTISALSQFGVNVYWKDDKSIIIPGSQTYKPSEVWVEGDYSNSAFFAAMNLLGSDITLEGLNSKSIQGDKVYEKYLDMLNTGTPTIHLGDCPDLGPVLMAVAAAKNGAIFNDTRRLKIKESDRGSAMAEELRKFGTDVTVYDNSIVVYPKEFHAPNGVLYGHSDHRIVMSLAVLLMLTGGEIEGAQAVDKSLPDFFQRLKKLGTEVEII
jgi:3-phosphoshikimate 1-carboxyvinyltransferase